VKERIRYSDQVPWLASQRTSGLAIDQHSASKGQPANDGSYRKRPSTAMYCVFWQRAGNGPDIKSINGTA